MKKLFSYMICVVGLVLVMCGSVSAADEPLQAGVAVGVSTATPGTVLFSSNMGSIDFNLPYANDIRVAMYEVGNSSQTLDTFMALRIPVSSIPGDGFSSYRISGISALQESAEMASIPVSRYAIFNNSFVNNMVPLYYTSGSNIIGSVKLSGPVSPNSDGSYTIPSTSDDYLYLVFQGGTLPPRYSYRIGGIYLSRLFSVVKFDPPLPPEWIPFLPDFALETTQQSILSKLDTPLTSIVTAINNLSTAVGTPSAMDKFESDYIQNFDNQLTKTEEYIGSDSPVIPGNFVTSGSDGSPSMVDSLKDGMGLSNSSFDSQAFQDASQAFSGPDSTSEGGMWWFFTQEIADALEATNSNSREEDTVDAWISDSERRWSIWGW